MPDPSAFLTNERPNEYEARFAIEGEVRMTFNASSPEEARAKADAMLKDEGFGSELDEVISAKLERVQKSRALYLVMRDGRPMQVSHLIEGDEPRQPDSHNF